MSYEALEARAAFFGPSGPDATAIDWPRFLNREIHAWPGGTDFLKKRTILITGAGGSIGSALARRLMQEPESRFLLVDISPTRLEALAQHYREENHAGVTAEFRQCDIRDAAKMREVFSTLRPDLVFHTAALKHLVPLETDPFVALETNVSGTSILIDQAIAWRVPFFVNVSTDKAVMPTSVLGVSKRIAERLVLAAESYEGHWISVRLGNVLGSSGSVVPLFLDAIRNRIPLVITHPDAARYFMTVEEAIAVLLNCIQLQDSSLLLPNMGHERKILDLAHFLMHLCSIETGITYTGLRDGEKCRETLTHGYEHLVDSDIPGLSRILGNQVQPDFVARLAGLTDIIDWRRSKLLIEALTSLEPEFSPSPTLLRYLSAGGPSRMP